MRAYDHEVRLFGHFPRKLETGAAACACHDNAFDISFLQAVVDDLYEFIRIVNAGLLEIVDGSFN